MNRSTTQLSMFDEPPPPKCTFVSRDEITWANLVILGVDPEPVDSARDSINTEDVCTK